MKILYLDCYMGAAGDMLTGALSELLPDSDSFFAEINELGIPGVEIRRESVTKCGICGSQVSVSVYGMEEEGEDEVSHSGAHSHPDEHGHHSHHDFRHTHSKLHQIEHLVSHLPLSEKVRGDVMAVYTRLAEAESHVHGVPMEEIHFHEVGTMDALADIVAVCMLMEKIAPDEVVVSPIHVGSGCVRCAHGILPVPAPATAYLLRKAPIYGGRVSGELCTPTGAALLTYFADRFGEMPSLCTETIGYGMGKKDFSSANCVRAFWGSVSDESETLIELLCTLDDMTPEALGFATKTLLEQSALEVYTSPVGMKKNRSGILLTVLCRASDRERMVYLIFKHTSTIGIRERVNHRYVLERCLQSVETPWGTVRKKISEGYGVRREKYEYDDLAEIAALKGCSLSDARNLVQEWEMKKGRGAFSEMSDG